MAGDITMAPIYVPCANACGVQIAAARVWAEILLGAVKGQWRIENG